LKKYDFREVFKILFSEFIFINLIESIQLWEQRIQAGAAEHGSSFEAIVRGLARCTISLNRKTLANLAIWEPRTFKVRYLP
jgi:hypothetical protein